MSVPEIPEAVAWRNGMVLEPRHFQQADGRSAILAHLACLVAEPSPWGFVSFRLDETALASSQLHIDCEGIFPGGMPFRERRLTRRLSPGNDGDQLSFHVLSDGNDGQVALAEGDEGPAESTLPAARLAFRGGVWGAEPDWSPPAFLIGSGHPLRADLNHQLGALAALGAGFMATLRLPGAEDRPAARMLGQVAAALVQGIGVLEALLAAPVVSPGRLGIEALRLTLGVRGAAGVFEPLEDTWDPADQRGSLRRLLYAAESVASGIGLPFRASLFRRVADSDMLLVDGMPAETLLLAIEASRPADLLAARSWLEGAALAAPDRIQEALTRRVAGCARRSIERDPRIGVSSGPLLALYHVDDDRSWRGGSPKLVLAAKTPPPNTSFSIFVPEGVSGTPAARHAGGGAGSRPSFSGSRLSGALSRGSRT